MMSVWEKQGSLKRNAGYLLVLEELEDVASGVNVEDMAVARELGAEINAFLSTIGKKDRILSVQRQKI